MDWRRVRGQSCELEMAMDGQAPQTVQILQSTLTRVPVVIGYLRPVILLPAVGFPMPVVLPDSIAPRQGKRQPRNGIRTTGGSGATAGFELQSVADSVRSVDPGGPR